MQGTMTYLSGLGVLGTTNGQTLTLGAVRDREYCIGTKRDDGINSSGCESVWGGNVTATGLITGNNGLTVSTGNITFSGLNTNNNTVLTTNGTGLLSQVTTSTANQCLVSNSAGSGPSWQTCPQGASSNYWQLNNNVLSQGNTTEDLTLGGTSTASARFAFIGNAGNATPVASISANAGNNATYLKRTGSTGDNEWADVNAWGSRDREYCIGTKRDDGINSSGCESVWAGDVYRNRVDNEGTMGLR